MPNHIIKNEMPSVLDLSSIKDVHGNPVTLRPKDGPGSTREVSHEATQHEAVQRVKDLKWISIKPVAVAEPAPAPAPVVEVKGTATTGDAPVPPVLAPAAPAAALEDAAAKIEEAVEPKAEEPAAETTSEEPKVEESTEDPRASRRNRR